MSGTPLIFLDLNPHYIVKTSSKVISASGRGRVKTTRLLFFLQDFFVFEA
jgi:hypothetical protein